VDFAIEKEDGRGDDLGNRNGGTGVDQLIRFGALAGELHERDRHKRQLKSREQTD
jgi:hypothetical protein